jgi:LacI family transcriptional regulator
VPDDVALVGFDDLPLAQHTQPPLTTVRQPLDRVGASAARRLLAELDGTTEPGDPILPTSLVLRSTT